MSGRRSCSSPGPTAAPRTPCSCGWVTTPRSPVWGHLPTFFFQNELPYDPPNQAAWQHDGTLGWAAYKVADHVRRHELAGVGSYIFTNVDPSLHASHGFEVPRTEGVRLRHLYTVNLTAGTLDSVVNGVGAPVTAKEAGQPSYVLDYS